MPPVMSRQDSRARAQQAYALRHTFGRTWQEIADELGYRSPGAAHTAVVRLEKRTPAASPESVRRSANDGLRIVRAVLMERFADAKVREDNDDLVMIAKELRNNLGETVKLNGAYVPVTQEHTVRVEHSATAILDRAERELLALSAERQRALPVLDVEVTEVEPE